MSPTPPQTSRHVNVRTMGPISLPRDPGDCDAGITQWQRPTAGRQESDGRPIDARSGVKLINYNLFVDSLVSRVISFSWESQELGTNCSKLENKQA